MLPTARYPFRVQGTRTQGGRSEPRTSYPVAAQSTPLPMPLRHPDAVIVGAGPNGLAAAVVLAEAGWRVLVFEANETVGGAARSGALTRPGFVHDLGSAVHPLAVASPLFRRLPLAQYGLEWVRPEVPLAHPLDGGRAVLLHQSLDETAAGLGTDGAAYRRLFGPLVRDWPALEHEVLGPLLRVPRRPLALARFGLQAIRSARGLAEASFETAPARALFAGLAAHSGLALDAPATASFGLVLSILAHRVGWPFPRGGAQALTDALAAHLRALGGRIVTGARVDAVDALPPARAVVLDVTPRQLLRLAGHRLPARTRRALEGYRYGPGAFKVDWALDAPIPWANPPCARAGTLHLGGTLEEIAESEKAVADGRPPERPYVLLAQPSRFDPTRAPAGQHTAWAYCHVPNGSTADMTAPIEAQVARFAPGFQGRVLDRAVATPADLERMNANLVGGDVNGGAQGLGQMVARPVFGPTPYRLARGLYLCSASTPPGGGVHGLCGFHAARAVLRDAKE